MRPITIYTFCVRDGRTGKWRATRHKMTIEEAAKRYGEGNYKALEGSKEVHQRWRRLLRQIFRFSK